MQYSLYERHKSMFTIEQHINKNIHKKARNGVFKTGMPLANPKHVNLRFTYKELTLVLGVLVALVIAFTAWTSQNDLNHSTENTHSTFKISAPIVQEVIKRSISAIWL